MIWEFEGVKYTIEHRPLKKAKRITVRKLADSHFAIRTPKHVKVHDLKALFEKELETLKTLDEPFDYAAYLENDTILLWGEPTDLFAGLSVSEKIKALDALLLEEISYIEIYYQKTQTLIDLSDLKYGVKTYQSKFGSCHPKKRIIRFNRLLIHYPKEHLESIYAHEITHLNVPNHQEAFYSLLAKIEPEHARLKKELHAFHHQFTRG